jgi:amidase
VTGPIEIEDVHAGDTVGLSILGLRTAPDAHSWTRPGIGIGPDFGYHVRRIDIEAARWPGQPDIGLNIRPHVGTLGVLPSGAREARDLGDYGGNVDMSELGAGATLWVRAQVDGAGVYAGDVHAGIADAEICGTGLETTGEIDLSVEVRTDWHPALPIITRGPRAWMISVDSTVERALVRATDTVVPLLSTHLHIPLAEAYLILGQLLEVRVCQVVNPHVSISVSLGQGLDACFGAPRVSPTEQHPSLRKAE